MLNHRMTRMHFFANDLSMAHSLDKMIADISECQLQISNDFPKKKDIFILRSTSTTWEKKNI